MNEYIFDQLIKMTNRVQMTTQRSSYFNTMIKVVFINLFVHLPLPFFLKAAASRPVGESRF